MWRFNDFKETLVMVKCLFPDVDVKERPSLRIIKKRKASKDSAKLKLPPLTKLERCLMCKLFFRRDLNEEFIGLIFDRHRNTIGKVLKEWAPRWGKAGEQCSILDVNKRFLDAEEPDRS